MKGEETEGAGGGNSVGVFKWAVENCQKGDFSSGYKKVGWDLVISDEIVTFGLNYNKC